MKRILILFIAILSSCTTPEIEVEKATVKTCYDIVKYVNGDIDYIVILRNGQFEKYQVPNIKDYYKPQICDLSKLKRL